MKKLALIPMKSRIAEIESVYATAAAQVIDILSALDPVTFTFVESGQALRKIQAIIQLLNDQIQMWAPSAIRAAYQESADVARTRLELIGAKKLPERRYNPARHDKKIGALTKTVMGDFFKANRAIEKTAKKYLATMAQAAAVINKKIQVQEFDIKDALPWIKALLKTARPADLLEYSWAEGTVGRKIKDYLLGKLKGESFIKINGRNYNVRSYAELVARTRMREAQTESSIEQNKQYDNDLVEIPTHEAPCDLCDEYVGNVYSISGDSDKYDKLPDGGPPFHPNCLCYINSVSESALAGRNK